MMRVIAIMIMSITPGIMLGELIARYMKKKGWWAV